MTSRINSLSRGILFIMAMVVWGMMFQISAANAAPPMPSSVSFVSKTDQAITFRWNYKAGYTSYDIYRADNPVGPYNWIDTVDNIMNSGAAIYADSGLQPGQEYCYKVATCDDWSCSGLSPNMCATTYSPDPPATYSISGRVTSNGSGLSNVAVSFNGYRAYTDGSGYYTINNISQGLNGNVTATASGYTFASSLQVTDIRQNLSGYDFNAYSDAPAAPSAPYVSASPISDTQIRLSWNSVSGATSYEVYQNGYLMGTALNTYYVQSSLYANTQYCYTVRACNGNVCSDYSTSVCARTSAAPVQTNNEPIYVNGSVSPSQQGVSGGTFLFDTVWRDPENNYIEDVRVRYRKQGALSWVEVSLGYVLNTNPPEFAQGTQIIGEAGTYEYQFSAVDTATLGGAALHARRWQGGGSFTLSAPVAQNREPSYLFGDVQPKQGDSGQNFTFKTQWSDPDNDYVVDVKVRYRKQGSTTWIGQPIILNYTGGTNPPEFNRTIKMLEGTGIYEFEFQASDANPAGAARKHTTAWKTGGTFSIGVPLPPATSSYNVCIGNNYEQQMPVPGVQPPSVNVGNVSSLNEGETVTLTANVPTIDGRGKAFFYWCANKGSFETVSSDYKTVKYRVPLTSVNNEPVRISVQVGDTLGYINSNTITPAVSGNLSKPVYQTSGLIYPKQVVSKLVSLVKSFRPPLAFKVKWPGSDIDLEIITPSGEKITPQSEKVVGFYEGLTEEYYIVNSDEQGVWRVNIIGVDVAAQGEPYDFSISVDENSEITEIPVLPNADTDGDGIPDAWEIQHGLNPLDKTDADEDADNDGVTNLDEYKANTDPNDPDSKPAPYSSGIFTVDSTGIVKIDWLYDGGAYRGEMGIFNIAGIENLTPGSPEFIAEAVKRVLSNSDQGYVVLSDPEEGARFSGLLGNEIKDWNAGPYKGLKSFTMQPGDKFATILVPNSTFATLAGDPATTDTNIRPLFSLVSPNPAYGTHIGQMADINGMGKAFSFEDKDAATSDWDFNDLIIQITGADSNLPTLDSLVGKDVSRSKRQKRDNAFTDWRINSELGKLIMEHIETPATGAVIITLDGTGDLTVYDSQGRLIGKEGGYIPGSTIEFANGNQIVSLPAVIDSDGYRLMLRSAEAGTCSLTVSGSGITNQQKQFQIAPYKVLKSEVSGGIVSDPAVPRNANGKILLCDFNGDGVVDESDIAKVKKLWKCKTGDACYDPFYDFDRDGQITVSDIMQVSYQYQAPVPAGISAD